jgi:hypothetical protein
VLIRVGMLQDHYDEFVFVGYHPPMGVRHDVSGCVLVCVGMWSTHPPCADMSRYFIAGVSKCLTEPKIPRLCFAIWSENFHVGIRLIDVSNVRSFPHWGSFVAGDITHIYYRLN